MGRTKEKDGMGIKVYFHVPYYEITSTSTTKLFGFCFDLELEQIISEGTVLPEENIVTGKVENVSYEHIALVKQDRLAGLKKELVSILDSEWSSSLKYKEHSFYEFGRFEVGQLKPEIYDNETMKIKKDVVLIVIDAEIKQLLSTFILKVIERN